MRVTTSYSNFARGKVDHDMNGRIDLPIYNTASDDMRNFVTNFKGNGIYRTSFEYILTHEDCAFVEFKFSNNQNYVLVLYENTMRFLSYDGSGNFGWVLSGGTPLEVTTPWTLAESKLISKTKSYTQNFDAMIICHPTNGEPQKLLRASSTSFTLKPYARKADPFISTAAATVNINAITQAATPTVTTAAPHGLATGDRVTFASVGGMTEINAWTAAVTVTGSTTFTIDVNTSAFNAYTAGGTIAKVLTGDYPRTCLFSKGRLYYANTPNRITTLFASESGQYYIHTLPTSVTDTSALQVTISVISQEISWLYEGDNSLIPGAADGIVAVNGGGVGEPITSATVEASLTSADGASSVQPFRKDGYIFYMSENKRTLNYFSYDILTETFNAADANILSYDISRGGIEKLRSVKNRNNLIWAVCNGTLVSCNFNKEENIIGWHTHSTNGTISDIAQISDNDGNQKLFVLAYRNSAFHIEVLTEYVEFKARGDFYTGVKATDDEAFYRYIAEQLKECRFLDCCSAYSDYHTETITYDSGTFRITASGAVFSSGDVGKHIVYKTVTGYESGRFQILSYISSTVVVVDILQPPTSNTSASWYLTFTTVSGLDRFNGDEVGVVADGGYDTDYTVTGGTITLPNQTTHVVIGYKYRGLIKSFNLGFQVQGENTQTTMKAISRVGVRTVHSAGGKVGSSPYDLEDVQRMDGNELNYLPPLPMDGTTIISYVDDHDVNKCFYIVQDDPLPLHITNIFIEAHYAVNR